MKYTYLNGQFIESEKAVVPITTHALQYGTGCFEGIRAYWNEEQKQLYVFKLKDHYQRLGRSTKTLHMKLPGTVEELVEITIELLRKNAPKENTYIRPFVYKKNTVIGNFNLDKLEDGFGLYTLPLNKYHEAAGLSVMISSWVRMDLRIIPPSAKPTGIYLNTALAKTEAETHGFHEAILLNLDGSVAEGTAENVFLVKNGQLITPATNQNILEGITRNTLIELAKKEFGIKTVQRKVLKNELFSADEIFVSGTGAEVTPVFELNSKKIRNGKIGLITAKLQQLYFNIVYGNNRKYKKWLTSIYS